MKIRTLPTLLVSGLTVLALSACGSNSSTSSTAVGASTPATNATAGSSSTAGTSQTSGSTGGSTTGSSDAVTTTAAPKPSTVQVLAGPGIKFDLAEYTATAGPVKVVYVNRDSQRHTLAIIDSEGKTLSGELEVAKSGATATHDYTLAAGTYKLICTVPGHQNMKATLTVS